MWLQLQERCGVRMNSRTCINSGSVLGQLMIRDQFLDCFGTVSVA